MLVWQECDTESLAPTSYPALKTASPVVLAVANIVDANNIANPVQS
jgi:hypothetical protein